MLFTTANGSYISPPKTWKGGSKNAAIPAWSRPYINNSTEEYPVGPPRKPNPQKTWRKQLQPNNVTGVGRASYTIQSDYPAANVYLGKENDCDCGKGNITIDMPDSGPTEQQDNSSDQWSVAGSQGADSLNQLFTNSNGTPLNGSYFFEGQIITQAIVDYMRIYLIADDQEAGSGVQWPSNLKNSTTGYNDWLETFDDTQEGESTINPPLTNDQKSCCNPEANVIRSAMTTKRINPYYDKTTGEKKTKTYAFSTAQYLKSKCKTYDQNLGAAKIPGINYTDTTNCCVEPIPYNDDNVQRSALNCGDCNGKAPAVIVKPNNKQYFQQGAVSSSSRIARLKYNTIQNNASSFKNAFGTAAANAGQYRGDSNAPYFIKSKTAPTNPCPKPGYRPQAFTVCWRTNPADTYRQNKTTQVVSQSSNK